MTLESTLARKMWRTMEPFHGFVYFIDEAAAAYADAGLAAGRMGYFASRSAPMGPVPAEVVIATFFNFHPALVRGCIPEAWRLATPARVLEARLSAVDAGLRRILGDQAASTEMKEAAGIARAAADACQPEGRPLFAGHASLAWPDEPHLVLWHAITVLREYRGDGHIAAMVAEGVTGCQALVIHGATGDVPNAVLQSSRAWPDDEWAVAVDDLRSRGWLGASGALTDAGRAHRQWVEDRTDVLAMAPWEAVGQDHADRLRALVRPWSKAIVQSGELAFRN
jgi:helix-turn-helix protein